MSAIEATPLTHEQAASVKLAAYLCGKIIDLYTTQIAATDMQIDLSEAIRRYQQWLARLIGYLQPLDAPTAPGAVINGQYSSELFTAWEQSLVIKTDDDGQRHYTRLQSALQAVMIEHGISA